MSNIPGVPDHAAEVAGELADRYVPAVTVTTATKAIVGATVSGVTAGASALTVALQDSVITGGEWINIVVAVLIGAGIVGQSVYAASNKPIV